MHHMMDGMEIVRVELSTRSINARRTAMAVLWAVWLIDQSTINQSINQSIEGCCFYNKKRLPSG